MRRLPSILALWLAAALAAAPARADTVEDRDGLFSHVTVLNLEDDQLVFVFNDGRSIQKPAESIRAIAVNAGNDTAADELTRAEALRLDSKRRDAIQLYQRAEQVGGKAWVRDFALMRLVGLYADSGDLWSSYGAYSKLVLNHPQLCQRIIPRRIPRKDSQVCRKILQDIEDVLSKPQPENLTAGLRRFRSAILRENQPAVNAQTTTRPAAAPTPVVSSIATPAAQRPKTAIPQALTPNPSATETRAAPRKAERPPAADPKPPGPNAKPPAAPSPADAVLAKGRAALKAGDLAAAEGLLDEARRLSSDVSSPAYLLLDSQIALARNRARQAGVQAMKIVLESPNCEEYPEALFVAGRAHEELKRYSKALELYRKCWIHPKAAPELQQQAKQRIAALTSPEAASADAPQPADKTVRPGDKTSKGGGKK